MPYLLRLSGLDPLEQPRNAVALYYSMATNALIHSAPVGLLCQTCGIPLELDLDIGIVQVLRNRLSERRKCLTVVLLWREGSRFFLVIGLTY